MHLTPKPGLHALALFAAVVLAAVAEADPPKAHKGSQRPARPSRTVVEERFLGYGLTDADAKQDAARRACEWLGRRSGTSSVLSADYLSDREMVRPAEPTEEDRERAKKVDLPEPVLVAAVNLVVTADQAREIQALVRQQRMEQRHWLVGRILAGLVALILVCGGYLRLEEATRGYYTLLLRAAALVVLAGVGAGLWLVR
jgi:hypothetical protein